MNRGRSHDALPGIFCLHLIVILCQMSGCVPNAQRQMTANPVRQLASKGYSLSYIEFDDQGELWQRCANWDQTGCQLSDTIRQIHEQGKQELLVLTYIHGWMSSASPNDGDRRKFEGVLQRLATDPNQQRPVVGIYIAWRGAVTRVPVIRSFSIWNRKNAAERIAGPSLTEALLMIMHATKGGNPDSTSVFVGHSLGGAMLEHALTQALVDQILHAETSRHHAASEGNTQILHPLCDLVVYVNSATEAIEAKEFIEIMKRSKVVVTRGRAAVAATSRAPLVVAITSETDRATRTLFPVMQGMTDADKSFRKYDESKQQMPSQRAFYNHTAGHMGFLWSHSVEKATCPDGNTQGDRSMIGLTLGSQSYCIKPIENAWNTSPYWIFRVPKEIVNGHADIWNRSFEALLWQILSDNEILTQGRETRLKVQ
jgi:hypothetical protein